MALEFGSYLNKEQPQENQFLQGNPSTQPNAQTSWMNPDTSDWNKYSGSMTGQMQAPQQNTPPANGTALGAISAGQVGASQPANQTPQNYGNAPLGFDQAKWADPNAGNSLKYQVGRMASQGMPIDQIAQNVGAKVIAPDKIQYPDGFIADIYFDYGGPNQRVQYTDVTPGGGQQQGQNQSFMGQGNQQNSFMQMLMQLLGGQGNNQQNRFAPQDSRNLPSQQFNPTGGYIPSNGNTGFAGGVDRGQPMPGNSQLPGYGDMTTSNPWRDSLSYRDIMNASGMPPFQSFLGGGVRDPITGQQRNPRPGEPQ